MKLMRNTRTGRVVVYDESLLATGRFEVYEPPSETQEQKDDPVEVCLSDVVSAVVIRGLSEVVEA